MVKYFISKGYGISTSTLNAFDNALINSGIANYNLVKLSSILPAESVQVSAVDLPKGSFLHTAYSSYIEDRPGIAIAAAVAIALPEDKSIPGVIMETSGAYEISTIEKNVKEMARTAMESRGIIEYSIQMDSISVITKEGVNCVIASVSIW